MRIVYLHQYFATPEMSTGTRSYEFARRLVRDGHEVHMITSDRSGGPRRTEDIEDIKVTWIPVRYSNSMSFLRRVWAFIVFAVLASVAGFRKNPSIVFATSTPLTIVIPALVIRWSKRAPMVFEVRDLWPEMPISIGAIRNPIIIKIARWLEKLAYHQSERVIALSPGMKKGVLATGYPEANVVVVPNGADIENFQIDPEVGKEWLASQDWYRGGPVVLYAGTFGLINEVSYLVEVANHTRRIDPDLVVLLVGSGQEEDLIEHRAKELGLLGQHVILLGQIPKRQIPIVYSAATVATSTVGAIPNIENNSANKFFDSLAAGRPILINHEGWLADLIDEWNCGLLLSRDPLQAARAITSYVSDDDAMENSRTQALKLANEMFGRDDLYARFRDTLLLAEGGS